MPATPVPPPAPALAAGTAAIGNANDNKETNTKLLARKSDMGGSSVVHFNQGAIDLVPWRLDGFLVDRNSTGNRPTEAGPATGTYD
jgi:hypothetical protein